MAGTRKGPRMIQEIQRLKALGLGKKTVARSLGISKNTVRQYWVLGEAQPAGSPSPADPTAAIVAVAKPKYEAPWAGRVDWPAVKQAVDSGEALAVWLEVTCTEANETGMVKVA